MVEGVAKAIAEQATGTEQIARAVTDVRGRVREIVQSTAAQTKAVAATATDLGTLARDLTEVRQAHVTQATAIVEIAGVLADVRGANVGNGSRAS